MGAVKTFVKNIVLVIVGTLLQKWGYYGFYLTPKIHF